MAFITISGEEKIAEKQGSGLPLTVANFVLAYIDLLGDEPTNRVESLPDSSDIVSTLPVTTSGYVNGNQVVYSLTMGATVGDFDFNWVGLTDDEGTLIAVTYIPLTQKRRTVGAVPGNTLTRNFLISYTGIQSTTAIDVPAETWQIDFNTRLAGIDERERVSNYDIYGHESFLDSGFLVTRQGNTAVYDIAPGIAYVGGVRAASSVTQTIETIGPSSVWMDVSLQGDISDVSTMVEFEADAVTHYDYKDSNGYTHYLTKIASIDIDGVVTDERVRYQSVEILKAYVDAKDNSNVFSTSGTENNIQLNSQTDIYSVKTLNNYDCFSFIVAETNASTVTIKIDDSGDVPLAGVTTANQIFKGALLTVRYIDGAFYIVGQVNPETGNNVLDIAKLYTDTVDISRPGEYALDGATLNRADHPIAFAIISESTNYVAQSAKDADPVGFGGSYGDGDGSTTFTLPIVGGEFIRMFDDGRGVDSGRTFGSWQQDAIRNIEGTIYGMHGPFYNADRAFRLNGQLNEFIPAAAAKDGTINPSEAFVLDASLVVPTADQNRPRSIAYYGKTRL